MRTQTLQYTNNPYPDVTETYYTYGSSDDGVAFVTEEQQVFNRLNDDATFDLLDAVITTILAALVDASDHGVVPVIHTDSLTAVHILKTIKGHSTQYARVAASFERKMIINLFPAHVGILGNELADQDAKRASYHGSCEVNTKLPVQSMLE